MWHDTRRSSNGAERGCASDAGERLQTLRAPAQDTPLSELVAATGDISLTVVREALQQLARVGGRGEAEVLRWRIWRADPSLLGEFAACIAALGDRRAIDEALVVLRCEDRGGRVYWDRVAAVTLLGAFADPATAAAIRGALDDPIGAVRQAAAKALGRLPAERENQLAVAACLSDGDPQVRAAAICSVAALDPNPGLRLGDLASDQSTVVRTVLARSAMLLGEQPTARLLGDPEIRVRELAAEHAGADAAGPQARALRLDSSRVVRMAAARRLGELGAVGASGALIDSLADRDSLVRVTALRSLSRLHDQGTLLCMLVGAIGEKAGEDRAALLYAVKRLGGARRCIGKLSALVDDPHPAVKVALGELARDVAESELLARDGGSLESIGGQSPHRAQELQQQEVTR